MLTVVDQAENGKPPSLLHQVSMALRLPHRGSNQITGYNSKE